MNLLLKKIQNYLFFKTVFFSFLWINKLRKNIKLWAFFKFPKA